MSNIKVTQLSLKIFLSELDALDKKTEQVRDSAACWLKVQEQRAEWGGIDTDYAYLAREALENALMNFREQMSTIYDFQADRGLVNFVPTGTYDE